MAQNDRSDQSSRRTLRRQMVNVADRVEYAIRFAVHALLVGDRRLADEIALECADIALELAALELHYSRLVNQPEFAASALRLLTALGSARAQAHHIAQEVPLSSAPPPSVARELELLTEQSRLLMGQAIRTWSDGDTARARDTLAAAREVDIALSAASQELLERGVHGVPPTPPTRSLVVALFKTLSKIGDNARRFCEETIDATSRATLRTSAIVPRA